MRISFVIPFHNEEKNAGPMLESVVAYAKRRKWQFEVIPINDRSTDKTQKVLDSYAKKYRVIRPVRRTSRREELGNTMGAALKLGTRKARGEVIIWTMGDRSDDPKTYGAIVQKIGKGFDMVFGSRYMPGGSRGSLDILKAFFSSNGTLLARIFFRVPVHDITNAFRGFRKDVFDRVYLQANDFSISPEFAIKAHLLGFRLGEVPTVYTTRFEGASSFKLLRMSVTYLFVYFRCLTKTTPFSKKR